MAETFISDANGGSVAVATEGARWSYLQRLDDELLIGGVVLSEWSVIVVRQADLAFVAGAWLAAILTAVAAIEAHLRSEALHEHRKTLAERIDTADVWETLRAELHSLRRYRNRWVHLDSQADDTALLNDTRPLERELESMAFRGIRALRKTLYADQWL